MGDKDEKGHDGGCASNFLALVVGVIFFFVLLLNAPGSFLLAFTVDYCNMTIDIGQFWTFSVIISSLIFIMLKILSNDYIKWYLRLCVTLVLGYLVMFYGFHMEFPLRHYRYLIPS